MNPFSDLGGAAAEPKPVTEPVAPESALVPLDEEIWARMVHAYTNGLVKGETCHIKELDPYYKWMPGYLNVWTGWMNEGKTEWIYQLLLLRAVLAEKKSALYSPENMPPEDVYGQLIHSLTGQNPDRDRDPAHRLTMARYKRAMEFVREKFVVVYPKRNQGRTPLHLVGAFEEAITKFGVSHCMMDPWNKADHSAINSMGGIEPYLVNTLGKLGDWSMDTKQSLIINAHPRQLPLMEQGKARPIPDSSHISGGQTWENMAHIAATYYRPWKHLPETDPLFSEVAIYVHKVKSRKLVGVRGSIGDGSDNSHVRIRYDWRSARYYINGVSPLDCRLAEICYLSDEELREYHDMRAAGPASAPAAPAPPAPLHNIHSTEFPLDEAPSPSGSFDLPDDWRPGGRIVKMPPND